MNTVEQVVAARLEAQMTAGELPAAGLADLSGRILREVERRRTRRRRLTQAGVAGLAAAAVVAVSVATLQGGGRSAAPPAGPTAPSLDLDSEWEEMLGDAAVESFPRALPDNRDFRANGLSADRDFRANALSAAGVLSGVDQSYNQNWMDDFDGFVVMDATTGEMTTYPAQLAQMLILDADQQRIVELGHLNPQHRFDVVCTDRGTGEMQQVTDGSVWETSVHLDDGNLAWTYYDDYPLTGDTREVWVSEGCGTPRQLDVRGGVVALDWPSVYVLDDRSGWLTRVDGNSGEQVQLPRPDRGVPSEVLPEDRNFSFDADADTAAWVLGTDLFVMDLASGATTTATADVPTAVGVNGSIVSVSVGDDLVAYSASPMDGDPATSVGLLYDPESGRLAQTGGETWVAGEWVAWLDGDNYRVGRVVR